MFSQSAVSGSGRREITKTARSTFLSSLLLTTRQWQHHIASRRQLPWTSLQSDLAGSHQHNMDKLGCLSSAGSTATAHNNYRAAKCNSSCYLINTMEKRCSTCSHLRQHTRISTWVALHVYVMECGAAAAQARTPRHQQQP
jgi:hypothetical protein